MSSPAHRAHRPGRQPGTYLLLLHLEQPLAALDIGQLGAYAFTAGTYLYVGSALGAGGLAARLAHHRRRYKPRAHWHIDYLRPHTTLREIWSIVCPQRLETAWGRALLALPNLQTPVPGFGASDSPLPTHLLATPALLPVNTLSRTLLAASPITDPAVGTITIEVELASVGHTLDV